MKKKKKNPRYDETYTIIRMKERDIYEFFLDFIK